MKLRKLCALALAGLLTLSALAGCTSAKTIVGGNTSSTSAESSSSSSSSEDSTASSESESSASTGEAMFASLADYLADPDVKASIDAEIENQTDDSMTIKVYADGNALVYEYQFTDEYDLSDEDIKPVSYTHLDVYKRQILNRMHSAVIAAAAAKDTTATST